MSLAGTPTEGTSTVRVLVVDDEPDTASLVAQYLERADAGLDVTVETDPEAGLDRVRDEPYDCVVSDYNMPEMDGLSFLAHVERCDGDVDRILHTSEEDAGLRRRVEDVDIAYVHKELTAARYEQLASLIRDRVGA